MRTVLFVICSLISIAAMATDRSEAQCDALIAQSLRGRGEEVYRAMNSRTVQECFKRFPGLNDKFFPIKMESSHNLKGPPINKDPAYSIKMR